VCISDTGIDSHSDLNVVASFNTINPSKSGKDDNGHGTHVAGTVAALDNSIGVVGVAPEALLIAAKGLSRSGSGFSSDLAETIDGCVARGAKVINMSWGSSSASAAIHDAILRAHQNGVLLIAAAGNESGPVIYPAAFPEVVAVSAVDFNEALASFSNGFHSLDLCGGRLRRSQWNEHGIASCRWSRGGAFVVEPVGLARRSRGYRYWIAPNPSGDPRAD
jgi:subtilisin family serine protease